MDQTAAYTDLLKTAPFEIIGSETIEGIDCYVVVLTPDMAQLWEMAAQQGAAAPPRGSYAAGLCTLNP